MKSDNLLHEGDTRPHDQTAACWCNPIRQRYNSLTGRWTEWDGEVWVDLPDPQPEPPDGRPVFVGNHVPEQTIEEPPATEVSEIVEEA